MYVADLYPIKCVCKSVVKLAPTLLHNVLPELWPLVTNDAVQVVANVLIYQTSDITDISMYQML